MESEACFDITLAQAAFTLCLPSLLENVLACPSATEMYMQLTAIMGGFVVPVPSQWASGKTTQLHIQPTQGDIVTAFLAFNLPLLTLFKLICNFYISFVFHTESSFLHN